MMQSWSALPDAPLAASGVDSAAIVRASGCTRYRAAARWLHELPYGRNADRGDYRLVLRERRGTCSTKHALLAAVAREQDIPVSLTVGIYDMSEANTPGVGSVLSRHRLESLPEAHCYLRFADRRVDVTRSGVSPAAPVAFFHREWTIEPSQIGEHKLRLHRRYLERWLGEHPVLGLSLEELWSVREACIRALGEPTAPG